MALKNEAQIFNAAYNPSAFALRGTVGTNPNPLNCSSTPGFMSVDQILNCVYDPVHKGLYVSGPGTVSSFSAGTLSPLFTVSVATPSTTPALSFTLINQNPNLIYAGPASGSSAAPGFRYAVPADMPPGAFDAAPLAVPTNSAFSSGAGGTLGAGIYCYRVTATNVLGETTASTQSCITLSSGSNNQVYVLATGFRNAMGCNIYGRTSAAELFMAAGSLSSDICSYIDTGVASPSGALPAANTTAGFTANGSPTLPNNISGVAASATAAQPGSFSIPVIPTPTNGVIGDIGTGGILLHNTQYCYRISATNALGETLAASEVCDLTADDGNDTHKVHMTATGLSRATGCNVYGRTAATELFIAAGTLSTGTCTFDDDGTVVTPSGALPAANSTAGVIAGGANGVTVSGVSCTITAVTGGIVTGATCGGGE
jgi:hypothetical protein